MTLPRPEQKCRKRKIFFVAIIYFKIKAQLRKAMDCSLGSNK
jgi:hypothetical protein